MLKTVKNGCGIRVDPPPLFFQNSHIFPFFILGSFPYALNFINCCFGSLFWLLGVPISQKVGSLFQSLGVPISLGDSEIVDTQSIFHIVDNVDNFDFVDNLTLMSSLTLLKLYC